MTEAQVLAFADPMLENILQAMGEDDYARYTADFDDKLKSSVTQSIFEKTNTKRVSIVGAYISKKFRAMKQDGELTSVIYMVDFSSDSNVTVTVNFKNIGGKNYVDGLYFASTLLQALK